MVGQMKKIKKKLFIAKKLLSKHKLKHLCVTITTNTSSGNKNVNFAPLRQIDDILIFGLVVYSTEQLKNISKIFDSTIKAIFVDTEKKIPHSIGNKYKKNYLVKKNKQSNEFIEYVMDIMRTRTSLWMPLEPISIMIGQLYTL